MLRRDVDDRTEFVMFTVWWDAGGAPSDQFDDDSQRALNGFVQLLMT